MQMLFCKYKLINELMYKINVCINLIYDERFFLQMLYEILLKNNIVKD